jgi:hypothetical protein
MDTRLRVDRYGELVLTDAIRPVASLRILPREGYRFYVYRDVRSRLQVPVLAAAVSRDSLFEVFVALQEPLSPVVDVVLETSHHSPSGTHRDLLREHIDLPVLLSHFYDFEDLLLNDGCTGVAVLSTIAQVEVQFDENKLLVVYAHDLEPFEEILRQAGIPRDDRLKLIMEDEHLHNTEPRWLDQFEQLCSRVGVAEAVEWVTG